MSEFYDDLADTAVELLQDFGQALTLTRTGTNAGTYDPATGTVSGGTSASYGGFGVALEYSQRDMDGTLIKVGDRRVYVAPDLAATPATGDKITLADGTVLSVVISRPLSPAGTIVLHDVQCRGV